MQLRKRHMQHENPKKKSADKPPAADMELFVIHRLRRGPQVTTDYPGPGFRPGLGF